MTIIGNIDAFAIEYEYTPEPACPERDPWLFGNIAYWIRGERVGRYDVTTSIRDGVIGAQSVLANSGRRIDPELMSMPGDEAFHRAYRGLFVDEGQSEKEVASDWARFSRLVGLPSSDVFDGWVGFLVEDDKTARFLWKEVSRADATVHDVILRSGEVDDVLSQFVDSVPKFDPP